MKSLFPIRKQRHGFTLIELLLVMAIIGVLSSLALVVIGEAQYDAQTNATQSRINQISSVLEETLEEYAVQRAPIRNIESFLNIDVVGDDIRGHAREVARRIMLEVINFELPRSYDSVALNNNPNINQIFSFPSLQFVEWFDDNEGIFQTVNGLTLVQQLQQNSVTFRSDRFRIPDQEFVAYPEGNEANPNAPSALIRTSSEYLYAILESTESQGILAIESLSDRAFANTDNDNYPEVVDSWGNPIGFFFEIFDEDGNLIDPNFLPAGAIATDLDSGFQAADDGTPVYPTAHNGIPARNIRIRIYSTGNKDVDQQAISLGFFNASSGQTVASITSFAQWLTTINSVETLVSN